MSLVKGISIVNIPVKVESVFRAFNGGDINRAEKSFCAEFIEDAFSSNEKGMRKGELRVSAIVRNGWQPGVGLFDTGFDNNVGYVRRGIPVVLDFQVANHCGMRIWDGMLMKVYARGATTYSNVGTGGKLICGGRLQGSISTFLGGMRGFFGDGKRVTYELQLSDEKIKLEESNKKETRSNDIGSVADRRLCFAVFAVLNFIVSIHLSFKCLDKNRKLLATALELWGFGLFALALLLWWMTNFSWSWGWWL